MVRRNPVMNRRARVAIVVTLIAAGLGAAGETCAQSGAKRGAADIGQSARSWLELQRTNASAAPALPMPGAQATLAYERYMDSFRTKIPESFGSTLSGESGAARLDRWNAGSGAMAPPGGN